jgi:hypothetical protein
MEIVSSHAHGIRQQVSTLVIELELHVLKKQQFSLLKLILILDPPSCRLLLSLTAGGNQLSKAHSEERI